MIIVTMDLCALFLYHGGAPREALLQNWQRLITFNHGVPVVPLLQDGDPVLPWTVDVRAFPSYGWVTENGHRSCDTMAYRWFLNRRFDAERYVVYEWDTFATTSLRKFYAPVWDADVACRVPIDFAIRPDWYWFREVPLLPEDAQPYAAGLAPFACSMFSHQALHRMVETPIIPDVFSELRSGTMARRAGLTVTPILYAEGQVSWNEDLIKVSRVASLYHPVKKLVSLPSRMFRRASWT